MNISGLQKMTLLDYPGKVAATVFTGGCNFRCPFCHNASLVLNYDMSHNIPEEEFFNFLSKRKGLLDGICISGGEPLLQADIVEFIAKVNSLGFSVKLDTNGSCFFRLKELIENRLVEYVAMDIKNSPSGYKKTAGVPEEVLQDINKSVKLLLKGIVDYEFRTTVVKEFHTREDFIEIGKWIKGAKRYYLQKFEDSNDTINPGLSAANKDEMMIFADAVRYYVPSVQLRGI